MQTFYVQQLINLRFMKKFVIINSIHAIFFSLSCICGRLSIMYYVSSWQKMTCICPNSISLLNNEIKFLQTEVDLQYRYLLIFRFNYHTWTSTSEYKIFLLFKAIQNATKFKLFFFLWHINAFKTSDWYAFCSFF